MTLDWYVANGLHSIPAGSTWIHNDGSDYVIWPDLTVRKHVIKEVWDVVAGPFDSLDAAKTAYILMIGGTP